MITMISAMSVNGIIGLKGANGLLWNSEVEMTFFRKNTIGNTVVMGSKTAETLEKPLIGRTNLVLSRKEPAGERDGFYYYNNMSDIISEYENFIVIGGEDLYNLFIDVADEVILTTLSIEFKGDSNYAYFPRDELEKNFFVVFESNMVTDVDKTSGLPINLIFSRWHRDIKRLH